jgi:hypothetical protein
VLGSSTADTTFHQRAPLPFSAGGVTSEIKASELPPGMFISFKGHPVFKAVKIQYPVRSHDPPLDLNDELKTGASVEVAFSHEPTNGECYLYVAIRIAVK